MFDFSFKSFFESLPQACLIVKTTLSEPVFVASNKTFHTISGIGRIGKEECLMEVWRQYQPQISESDLLVIRASIKYVIAQKHKHNMRTLCAPYLEIESTPLFDQSGNVNFISQFIQPCSIPDRLLSFSQTLMGKKLNAFASYTSNNNIIAQIDKNGFIINVNEHFCDVSGYNKGKLIGFTYQKVCFEYYDQTFFQNLWETVSSGNTWSGEVCNKNSSGTLYWVKTTIIPFFEDGDNAYQYLSIQNDITKNKLAEEKVVLVERKYGLLFEQSPVPMWIYDLDTLCFEDVNEAAIRHYGYSKTEFMKMNLKDIRPEEDIAILEFAINRIRKQYNSSRPGMYRHLKKNKEIISVKIESRKFQIDDKIKCIVWIHDVTEEELARKLLIRTNMHLEAAKDITDLGYWTLDTKTKNINWFYNTFKIFEENPSTYSPSFEKLESLFHPDDRHFLHIDHHLILSNGNTYSFEARIITCNGNIKWLFHKLKAVLDDKNEILALEGVCLDITGRKAQETQIIRKNQLLNALNSITCLLFSHNESWIKMLQDAFKILADTLKTEFICVFEYDQRGKQIDYNYINHKLAWSTYSQSITFEDNLYQKIHLILDKSFLSHLLSGDEIWNTDQLQNSEFKDYMKRMGIGAFYVSKIATNADSYGFICFQISDTTLWKEDDFLFLRSVVVHLSAIWKIKANADEISKRHEQFHSVINNVPGIIYRGRHDDLRTMVFMGDMTENLTGYNVTDFIDNLIRPYSSIIHPEDISSIEQIDQALENRKSFDIQYRIRNASGKIIWVHERGRGIYNQWGKLLWVDGVIMDISESKEREQQLKESNQRFLLMMKVSQEAIIDWDIKNDTTLWGDGFQNIFGYQPSEYHNHLWSDNIHPEERDRVLSSLNTALANPSQLDFTAVFNFYRADRSIAYVHHKGIFIRNALGEAIKAIGSMTDMTDLFSYTRTIETQHKLLKDITWAQSHLIRAPLTRLLSLLGMHHNRKKLELDDETLIEYMLNAGQELDSVICDIIKKTEKIDSLK